MTYRDMNTMTENQISDAVLVERFQSGDHEAMNALVQRHQSRAYHYAYKLTKDQDMAADVVAESFLRVFKASHAFKGQSSFTTWLYRIITNCYLDMRKKAQSRPSVALDWLFSSNNPKASIEVEDHAPQAYEMLVESQQRLSLSTRIAGLPVLQRAVIQLYHGEMLSYEEIAETLALPVGTVKSRLNRARLRLREALSSERTLFGMPARATQ